MVHRVFSLIFIILQRYYIDTARELQRLVGVCKAPIIQHFVESISGSTTIRSFCKENQFISTNSMLMDTYSRPKFYNAGAMEWLCFRMDMLSSLTFAFCLVFLINLPTGLINPGMMLVPDLKNSNLRSILRLKVREILQQYEPKKKQRKRSRTVFVLNRW